MLREGKLTVKQLVFCAMAIALGTVLSNIKLFSFPWGGSVTLLSMLVICLPGYFFGLAAGLLAGVAYGVLQLLIDPYVLYPMQLVVDYLLAFGALGLSGLFSRSKNGLVKGYIAAVFGRYLFAVLFGRAVSLFLPVNTGESHGTAQQDKDEYHQQDTAESGGDIGVFSPFVDNNIIQHKKSSFVGARRDDIVIRFFHSPIKNRYPQHNFAEYFQPQSPPRFRPIERGRTGTGIRIEHTVLADLRKQSPDSCPMITGVRTL